jgi:hypothetical protein
LEDKRKLVYIINQIKLCTLFLKIYPGTACHSRFQLIYNFLGPLYAAGKKYLPRHFSDLYNKGSGHKKAFLQNRKAWNI